VVEAELNRDRINRTALQLFHAGRAETLEAAEEALRHLVIQVDVGRGLERDPGAQAALLTIVNAGARAFLGGVRVLINDDAELSTGWARGRTISESVRVLGGEVVRAHEPAHPTIVVGTFPARAATGSIVCVATCNGWAGGVLQPGAEPPQEAGIAPAGVLAGGMAVSECFQHCCGSVEAGRREAGLSLWVPGTPWLEPAATGPALEYLPDRLWLLGLGHLGQANAWTLGMLPYASGAARIFLLDSDEIVSGNQATGLLSNDGNVGQMKTRAVGAALEAIGLQTRMVERLFDEHTWPRDDEPRLALAGFDSPVPRRQLGGERFARVVDAGLGKGAEEYLDILLHTFPSPEDPASAFASEPREVPSALPACFAKEVERLIADGADAAATRCGMTEIAGVTVGAAFVGATAAALTVGDILRWLHGGTELSVLAFDLRTPTVVFASENDTPGPFTNTGFVRVRREPA
jgi:hypothetical protein